MAVERRRAFRVDTELRVNLDAATPPGDDPAALVGRIAEPALPELAILVKDPDGLPPDIHLLALLERINGKARLALELLRESEGHSRKRPVNLSVTGMRLDWTEEFAPGTVVRVSLLIDSPAPIQELELFARVVRVRPLTENQNFETALDFLPMSEDAEAALCRHVFIRQRRRSQV